MSSRFSCNRRVHTGDGVHRKPEASLAIRERNKGNVTPLATALKLIAEDNGIRELDFRHTPTHGYEPATEKITALLSSGTTPVSPVYPEHFCPDRSQREQQFNYKLMNETTSVHFMEDWQS